MLPTRPPHRPQTSAPVVACALLILAAMAASELGAQELRLRSKNTTRLAGTLLADPAPTSWPEPGISLRLALEERPSTEVTVVCVGELISQCSRLRRDDRIRHARGELRRSPGTVEQPIGYVDARDLVLIAADIDT